MARGSVDSTPSMRCKGRITSAAENPESDNCKSEILNRPMWLSGGVVRIAPASTRSFRLLSFLFERSLLVFGQFGFAAHMPLHGRGRTHRNARPKLHLFDDVEGSRLSALALASHNRSLKAL